MKTFNLSDMVTKADNYEDSSDSEFFVPEDGAEYEATIRYASTKEAKNGLPSWWIILTTEDGDFPLYMGLNPDHDFINKRTFNNLRAAGVTSFDNLNPEHAAQVIEGASVRVKVKWGKPKKKGDEPFANHILSPLVEDIPEPDDDY